MNQKPPNNSELIKLGKAPAKVLELTGVTRTRETIYQWAKYGRNAQDGTMIKLRTVRRLGQLYTTQKWLEDFIRKLA